MTTFGGSAMATAAGVCFSGVLLAASVWDVRTRRIPNVLVLAFTVLGLAYNLSTSPLSQGVSKTVVGFALGFALWIPFYALRMLGAGDVKLFAAGSCWLVPSQIFGAAVTSALAGGVLSLIGLFLAHGFGLTTFRLAHAFRDPKMLATPLPVPSGRRTLPYGLAMTIGLLIAVWFPQWLRLG